MYWKKYYSHVALDVSVFYALSINEDEPDWKVVALKFEAAKAARQLDQSTFAYWVLLGPSGCSGFGSFWVLY